MGNLIITIDGPAGSGKTTIAKLLSKELKIAYLDTGAMYRAVALVLGENGWNKHRDEIENILKEIKFELAPGEGEDFVLKMNNKPLGNEIRNEKIGLWASNVGKLPVVRKYLMEAQREIARNCSLVAEGRDMGTVVFPHANFKFFLSASLEVRAKRRIIQLKELGILADYNAILKEMEKRDIQDKTREIAPLHPAEDAIKIDTSNMSKTEVLKKMLERIYKRES
jgi:cytidylate kinase